MAGEPGTQFVVAQAAQRLDRLLLQVVEIDARFDRKTASDSCRNG
ncbi:MAG TPA: hypothetical protein VFE60_15205 [Roseiarcus sp.]|jgi:hypothetical protein|nr:hypothetical protein [Roseiarcus sp.]